MKRLATLIFLMLIFEQAYCNSMYGCFGMTDGRFAAVNFDTNEYINGRLEPEPEDTLWTKFSTIKSVTVDDSGNIYCINSSNSDIYAIDNLSVGQASTIANIPGIINIEAANGKIYGLTSTALYTVQSGKVAKLCDMDNYHDIAISEKGRIIGLKQVENDVTRPLPGWDDDLNFDEIDESMYGIFDIDPYTGQATQLGNYVEVIKDDFHADELYISDTERAYVKSLLYPGEICFSNDGGFWYRNVHGLFSVNLNEMIHFEGEYLDALSRGHIALGDSKYGEFDYFLSTTQSFDTSNIMFNNSISSFDVYVVPEPLSLILLGLGTILIRYRN